MTPTNPKQQDSIIRLIEQKTKYCPKDGKCYKCQKDIYKELIITQETKEITGCPYCHYSFID